MCGRPCLAVSVVLLAYLVYYVYDLLGVGVELTFNDHGCQLIGDDVMPGSEDIAHVGGGVFLVSSADLDEVFGGDAVDAVAQPQNEGLYVVDVKLSPPSPSLLPIKGLPATFPFHPHGLYFSNVTRRVLVVSHGLAKGKGSRIIVLKLVETEGSLSLEYERSIVSPLFRNGAINDVIEGVTAGELYVTEWLQYPLPAAGKHHPANTEEKLDLVKQKIAQIISPGTRVFRCTYSGGDDTPADCDVAVRGLYVANGITKNPDNSAFFVNDVTANTIVIFSRDATTGSLAEQGRIRLKYGVDNIEWAAPGTLMMGNIPVGYKALAKMDGHEVDVPGGLTTATHKPTREDPYRYEVDNSVLMHDGTKLSQISAGYGWGGMVILGSPFTKGMLVCRL